VNVNVTLHVGAATQTLTVSSAAAGQLNIRSQTISNEVTLPIPYLEASVQFLT
jgi:hypothetical protein